MESELSSQPPVLHIFGGGIFIGIAEEIAHQAGWSVIVRTGARFADDSLSLSQQTRIFVGNDLHQLMKEGGLPRSQDYGISFSAPWIFPQSVINMFGENLFNLHNQPLPRFRGGGGASWTIMMGERSGGCCIHRLVRKVDAGEIFARRDFQFPEECKYPVDFDTYVINQAAQMIREWLPVLLKHRSPGVALPIDEDQSEYWPRLNTVTHGWINWSWRLSEIQDFCNAFSYPHGGARTMLNGRIVEILSVSIVLGRKFHPFQSGLIFRLSDGLMVAHREGVLRIHEFRFLDEGTRVAVGDRLFTPQEHLDQAMMRRVQYLPSGQLVVSNESR